MLKGGSRRWRWRSIGADPPSHYRIDAMRQNLRERLNITDVFMWVVGALLVVLIIVGSISTLLKGTYNERQWFDFVVFGIAQGAIYALIALGYTLVYGILRMINFAHSEVFMSGPFTAYFL